MAFQFTVCPLDSCKRPVRFSDKATDKATIDALMLSHGGCSRCTHKKRDREKRRLDREILTRVKARVRDFEVIGKERVIDADMASLYDLHRNLDYEFTLLAADIRAREKFNPVRNPNAKPRGPKVVKLTAAEKTQLEGERT